MRYDILSVIAFAVATAGAALGSSSARSQDSISIEEAKAYCPGGDVACCQNTEIIKGDGVLGNLLAKGALNNLLGVGDSSCAKTSLIENLNILGMSHQLSYSWTIADIVQDSQLRVWMARLAPAPLPAAVETA